MKKFIKLIFLNIIVFLGLLILINLAVILVFRGYKLIKPRIDPWSNLPNYKNIDWVATHYKEFMKLPTEYRSYIGWRRPPFRGKTINIDQEGIRFTPQHGAVDTSSTLVVFLGGSAMWGSGSDDINTIPAKFSMLANGEYCSLNLAESGYNAFQGYIRLKIETMEGLRPGIIICYDGANEIDALDPSARPFSHARENQIKKFMQGQDNNDQLSIKHFFINPLQVFIGKLAFKIRRIQMNEAADGNSLSIDYERVKQVATDLIGSWQSTKELADNTGADFIAALQPIIYMGNPRSDYLTVDESLRAKYQALYSAVAKILQEPGYRNLSPYVLDLTSAFDGEEYIYIDDIHVSPNGNAIIARRIHDHISKMNEAK